MFIQRLNTLMNKMKKQSHALHFCPRRVAKLFILATLRYGDTVTLRIFYVAVATLFLVAAAPLTFVVYKNGLFGFGAGVMDEAKVGTLVIQGFVSTTADFSCRNGFGAAANRSLLLSEG